jgi:uncharacterized protein YjdB
MRQSINRPSTLRHFTWLFSAALAFTLSACSASVTDTPQVAQVQLTPPSASLEAGRTLVLVARPTDASGAAVTTRQITWSSNNTQVATVSAAGVVSARVPGEARIAASVGGQSATTTITVTGREVASVQVAPVSVSVRVTRTAQLSASALDADGVPLSGRTFTWSSSNTSVATITQAGVITAVAPGAATITATTEGRSGQAAVTVTPEPVASVTIAPTRDTLAVGTDRTFVATVRDESGAALTGRTVVWNVSDPAIATVSSTGVVTARSPGTVTVVAVSENRVGQATLVVLQRLANAVILTPSSATLETNATVQLVTQVTDPSGNLIPGRVVTYTSNNTAAATVSNSGLVTARAPGVARITATSDGRSSVATITVIAVPVSTVQVSPLTNDVLTGSTVPLTVQVRSATGTLLTGRTVTWTSGAPSVATVSASGVVTAVSPGIAVIAATVDGISGFATVTVRAPTVAAIVITPNAPELTVDARVLLSASVRDGNGNILTGRAVTWRSSNEQVAFVSSTGTVIAISAGTATITATSEGVSASILVTVR